MTRPGTSAFRSARHEALAAALATVLAACGSGASPDGGNDATSSSDVASDATTGPDVVTPPADAGLDALADTVEGMDAGADVVAAGDSGRGDARAVPDAGCTSGGAPPTRSFALASWPSYPAATATDLTAAAHVATTSLAGAPAGVLLARDGQHVFAAINGSPGHVVVLQRTGDALTVARSVAMPANETPFGLAQSPDGSTIAVSLSDEVALLDTAMLEAGSAGALLATVPTHSTMRTTIDAAFSRDGRFVFAALEYDRAVAVVNAATRAYVGAVPVMGNAVTGVERSPDGTRLYVTTEVADEFSAANPHPATDQVVGVITVVDAAVATTNPAGAVLGRAFVGRAPVRSVITSDGATLWVTARGSNALIALDTATLLSTTCNPVRASVAVGPAPVGLALVGGDARVAVADSNRFAAPMANQTVMFVDAARAFAGASNPRVGEVTVGAFPREISDDATALFVSNYNSRSISGLDLTTLPAP